jgi:hypothetical protein
VVAPVPEPGDPFDPLFAEPGDPLPAEPGLEACPPGAVVVPERLTVDPSTELLDREGPDPFAE